MIVQSASLRVKKLRTGEGDQAFHKIAYHKGIENLQKDLQSIRTLDFNASAGSAKDSSENQDTSITQLRELDMYASPKLVQKESVHYSTL